MCCNINENFSCKNYLIDIDAGFKYLEFRSDTTLEKQLSKWQQFKQDFGGTAMLIILLIFFFIIGQIARKLKLKN